MRQPEAATRARANSQRGYPKTNRSHENENRRSHLLNGRKGSSCGSNFNGARFFTLAGWGWRLSNRHGFDFIVTFPCGHSVCDGSHTLAVRICEKTHDALERKHEDLYDVHVMYAKPHPALFGDGPENTHWQMVHGHGGGPETVSVWAGNAKELWRRAANE